MSVQLTVHVSRAEGLVGQKDGPPDTYVKVEIEGNKKSSKKSETVQNSDAPVWEQDLQIECSKPDDEVLVITVVAKDVARDEAICDKVKIPVKEFLPVGKEEERAIDLKLKKKSAGKLYLRFRSAPGAGGAEVVDGPIAKKSHKKSGDKDKKKSGDKDKKKSSSSDKKRKSSSGDKDKKKSSSGDKKKSEKKKKEEPPATYNLHIKCESGRDLVAADKGKTSDPYCLFRMEGSSKKVMNKCVENSLNPVWGDAVVVPGVAPGNDILRIQVTDKDHEQGSKNDDPIGYAEIPVRELAPFGHCVTKEIPLRKVDKKGKPEKKSKPGDAGFVTLQFHVAQSDKEPFQEYDWDFHPFNLKVKVIKAKDVASKDLNGKSDPFCILKLKGVSNEQVQKTKVVKEDLNPEWNEEFAFLLNYPDTDILKITMLDQDKLSKADKMSKIYLPLAEFPPNQWVPVERTMTPIGSANRPGEIFLQVYLEDTYTAPPPPPAVEEKKVEVVAGEHCHFHWGSYSSSYSTSFSGYTNCSKTLSALRSSEERWHVHEHVHPKEHKPKPKGETLKGTVVEGKNLIQIEKFQDGFEAYVEVKLVGKGKDKKGKSIQTEPLSAAEAQWNKEFDFGKVKKGQAVEIILWIKHSLQPEFVQYGYARVEVKNIAFDNEEPQTFQLGKPPKAGFLQRLGQDIIEYGQVVLQFKHHIDE